MKVVENPLELQFLVLKPLRKCFGRIVLRQIEMRQRLLLSLTCKKAETTMNNRTMMMLIMMMSIVNLRLH